LSSDALLFALIIVKQHQKRLVPMSFGNILFFLFIYLYSANSIKKNLFSIQKALYSKKIYTGVGNRNLQTSGHLQMKW
jgi:hypothetical protein